MSTKATTIPPRKRMAPVCTKPRIAIVDSQPSSRIGLSHFIKKIGLWEIAWASATAEEALTKIAEAQPDLMILEIQLPGKDGLELIKHLMPLYPQLKVLVHSAHVEEFYAERCLRAGAMGYLHKMDPMGNFENAVKSVLRGEIYLNPRLTRYSLHSMVHHANNMKGNDNNLHNLTDRELEVMILMAKGHSCRDSAEKFHISPRTVQVHRNNIRLKIGLESAVALHAYSVRFYGEDSLSQIHDDGLIQSTPEMATSVADFVPKKHSKGNGATPMKPKNGSGKTASRSDVTKASPRT
jgi:DNA-binding NarL/FixJ family response regulator